MKKKELLGVLNKSILQDDVTTGRLYEKYYPLIAAVLEPFPDKTKLELNSLIGATKNGFEAFVRSNDAGRIEEELKKLLKELRVWARSKQPAAGKAPDGATQARMRAEVVGRIDALLREYTPEDEPSQERFKRLRSVRDELEGSFLPRDDIRIVSCYDAVMEALDTVKFECAATVTDGDETARNALENIIQKLTDWLNLKR